MRSGPGGLHQLSLCIKGFQTPLGIYGSILILMISAGKQSQGLGGEGSEDWVIIMTARPADMQMAILLFSPESFKEKKSTVAFLSWVLTSPALTPGFHPQDYKGEGEINLGKLFFDLH